MTYSGCGICQAFSNLLPWLSVPCPAQDRQAGEQCTFPPLLGTTHVLEDGHIPCNCNDPPSPSPNSTITSRHRKGIYFTFPGPLINHTGSEHPYIPPWWTGRGNDLPRALAQYLASAWIAPSPEPASACRGHRNMPCPICTFPQALGTRTCTCPSRRVWRGEWDDNNCLRLQRTESTFLQVLGFGQTSPFLRLLLL